MTSPSGEKPLHRVIYFSRRTASAHPDGVVRSIVAAADRNNGQAQVTGLLLAHRDWFVHGLEGPFDGVIKTYCRLLRDRRHSDVTTISAGPAVAREFGAWTLCAHRLDSWDEAVLFDLNMTDGFDPCRLNGPGGLNLLIAIRDSRPSTAVHLVD